MKKVKKIKFHILIFDFGSVLVKKPQIKIFPKKKVIIGFMLMSIYNVTLSLYGHVTL